MYDALNTWEDMTPYGQDLLAQGIKAVGRYIFNASAFKKLLTAAEAKHLSSLGLKLFTIWEDGSPTTPAYFTTARAKADYEAAYLHVKMLGMPSDATVYFAVDADLSPDDVKAYFDCIEASCCDDGYPFGIGAYASGTVLQFLADRGVINHGMLSESRGWSGFDAYKGSADILQVETKPFVGSDGKQNDVDWCRIQNEDAGFWSLP